MILTRRDINVLQDLWRRAKLKLQSGYNKATGAHEGELENIKQINGVGTDIVNLDSGVIRVTPTTKQRGTLFNEFTPTLRELDKTSIRSAKEYKDNPNVEIAVKKGSVPASNFHLYAGIEDGHFKVDSLKNFNDTTTIFPARNIKEGTPAFKKIIFKDPEDARQKIKENKALIKQYKKELSEINPGKLYDYESADNIFYNLAKKLGRKPTDEELNNLTKRLILAQADRDYNLPLNTGDLVDALSSLEEELFKKRDATFYKDTKPLHDRYLHLFNIDREMPILLYTRSSYGIHGDSKRLSDSIFADLRLPKKEVQKYLKYRDNSNYYDRLYHQVHLLENKSNNNENRFAGLSVVTVDDDTIPIGKYNASILDKKLVLGNPTGGLFVGDFKNLSKHQFNLVNDYLAHHPSWLYMPDMGQNSLYGLLNGQDPKLKHSQTKTTYDDYWHQFTETESKMPYDPRMHFLVGKEKSGGKLNYLNIFK